MVNEGKSARDPRKAKAAVPAAPVVEAPAVVPAAKYVPMNIALPTLATGGDLATWKSDLVRVQEIAVSADDGKTWITVHAPGKKWEGPADQYRAVIFTALSRASSPSTDRGYAYREWANTHAATLLERLGKYQVQIKFGSKSIIPGLEFSVKEAVTIAKLEYEFLSKSLEKFQPRKREVQAHVQADGEYLVIL